MILQCSEFYKYSYFHFFIITMNNVLYYTLDIFQLTNCQLQNNNFSNFYLIFISNLLLGRGKMKKMMGMMAMGFAMKMAAMVPIAIAGLFLLAGKALITSKVKKIHI